jgi:hypothetical protein
MGEMAVRIPVDRHFPEPQHHGLQDSWHILPPSQACMAEGFQIGLAATQNLREMMIIGRIRHCGV